MFYSVSTDALLKFKVWLCFNFPYPGFIWNFNDLCMKTGSLQQLWIWYTTNVSTERTGTVATGLEHIEKNIQSREYSVENVHIM